MPVNRLAMERHRKGKEGKEKKNRGGLMHAGGAVDRDVMKAWID